MKTTSSSLPVQLAWLLGSSLFLFSSSCSDSTSGDANGRASGATSEAGTTEPVDDDRPDLVLLTIDAFRPDRSPVYGSSQPTTPALQRLAEQSLVFERATTTMPLTLPAHASMLTGLLPPEHGVRDDVECSLDQVHPSLGTVLAKSGYRTGAFVGSLDLHVKYGLGRSFQHYDDSIERAVQYGNDPSARPGTEVVRLALEWLSESTTRPAFLLVNLAEPDARHTGLEQPGGEFEQAYDARLAAADAALAELIGGLEEQGRLESCALIVTSSSGEGLGDHGETGHGYLLYDSTLRVPLVVKTPGSRSVGRVSSPASLIDIPTTLLRIAGEAALPIDGIDLVQLAETPQPNREVYAESLLPTRYQRAPHFSLTAGDWKYIHSSTAALYDLGQDPGETKNLIEAERERATELNGKLSELRGQRALTGEAPEPFLASHELIETLPELLESGQLQQLLTECDRLDEQYEGLIVTAYFRMLAEVETISRLDPDAAAELVKSFLAEYPIRRRPVTGKLDPYPSAAGLELGLMLVEQGRGSESIYPLKDALRSRPHEVVGHIAVGESFIQIERKKPGLKALQLAANIESTADLENTLGILQGEEGNLDKSHEHFKKAVAFEPDNALYQANIARSYTARYEWTEAFEAFRRSLELDPYQPELELEFAYFLATVNEVEYRDVDSAMEHVASALKKDLPETAATLAGVAEIYAEAQVYDVAIKFAERALELAKAEGETKQVIRIMDSISTYHFEAEQVEE